MLTSSNKTMTLILIALCSVLLFLFMHLSKKTKKKQLEMTFQIVFGLLMFWILGLILQIFGVAYFDINPMYFDYFVYIAICFMPVALFFLARIYAKTKINFKKKHLLLLVIPTLSLLLLWTNDWHHLFYKTYSTNAAECVFGPYFTVHQIYTIVMYLIALLTLMRYSIKNSGFFSKPALLILIGVLIPIITNALGAAGVVEMSIYITPITFAFTVICLSFAIFRFNILKTTPIALQTIVDRISDSYAILNEDYEITDFNATFIKTFKIKEPQNLRGKHFAVFLNEIGVKNQIPEFGKYLEKVDISKKMGKFEAEIRKANKIFNVEITSIVSNGDLIGILVLFKDITQHINDMHALKDNQDLLIEQERLASLGQMIGGIAHNLKTPIFSVAGGLEGLSDLIKEYDESIDDPNVTPQDMHDIASDMNEWIVKLKDHIAYMSDVITTVKGQAVNMSDQDNILFPVSELFQHVNILMQHEIKENLADLEVKNKVPDIVKINGNINSLVQVINNLISNALEAYRRFSKQKNNSFFRI